MQIQLGASSALAALTQADNRAARAEARAEKEVDKTVVDEAVETKAVESKEVPGVLRMLQEGKFNGVADVRLRIVHAEKLEALEAAQSQDAVTESSDALVASVSSTVSELAEASEDISAEQADAIVADFEAQLTAAIDTLFAADELDVESFAASLQGAFQSLVEQLGLGAVADEAVTVASEEVVVEDAVASRDYLAELTAIFDAELTAIMDSTDYEVTMPPLSEANGNGRAYDKFVAIYNELQSSDVVAEEPSASLIDVVT